MTNLYTDHYLEEANGLHVFFSSKLQNSFLVSEKSLVVCPYWVSLISLFVLFCTGGTCQSPALPALVRPPAPPLQPSLDIKPFLPFPLDTAAAVNLFPNFNAVSTTAMFEFVRVVSSTKAEARVNRLLSPVLLILWFESHDEACCLGVM